MKIAFDEWLPDLADQGNPGSTEAKNVQPTIDGYRPLNALQTTSDALDSECLGGIAVKGSDGTIYNFAGSRFSLWELSGADWIRRSSSGGIYYEPLSPGSLKLSGVTAETVIVSAYEATPGTIKLTGASATFDIASSYFSVPSSLSLTGATADVVGVTNYTFESTVGTMKLAGISGDVDITVGSFVLDPLEEDSWEFAQWGQKVIAVGGHKVNPRIITLGNSAFDTLSGTPPKARHIAVVRNFVVMGNVDEGGTIFPYRLRWSGINDETNWTTSKVKQSDYQDLYSAHRNGEIQAIRGGGYGVIVTEHSTWTMEYIGPPQIFAFNERLPYVGTPSPHSVVRVGDEIFMLGQNGFVAIAGGGAVREIGNNKINKWFFDNCDQGSIFRLVGAWDRRKRIIVWVFPGLTNDLGLPNNGLIYSIESNKWSRFERDTEWVFSGLGQSLTLEQLDPIYPNIDTMTISLDSSSWTQNDLNITAFDHDHKSGQFDGSPMDATIETSEAQPTPYNRTLISRIRLEVDTPGTATIKCGTRASQSDSVVWSDSVSEASNGSYPVRCESRYHRFQATITGGFDRAQGMTIEEARDTGAR